MFTNAGPRVQVDSTSLDFLSAGGLIIVGEVSSDRYNLHDLYDVFMMLDRFAVVCEAGVQQGAQHATLWHSGGLVVMGRMNAYERTN